MADAVVRWLLASSEPAIRFLTRRDLLGEAGREDEARILEGPLVRGLLDGQRPDCGFGVDVYAKWGGAHWRLVSLAHLGIPAGEPRAVAAMETVLRWLTGSSHVRSVPVIEGLAHRCGSQEGNALGVAIRLGLTTDPRVEQLAYGLMAWQWPDGGWNCDRRPEARRSSFHETLTPMWGLDEFARATGDSDAAAAARRAAELLLEHRLFRSLRTGEPINRSWLQPQWPPYWHYDILHAMAVLAGMDLAADPRAEDAIAALEERRRPDGRWRASTRWWKPPGSSGGTVEVVDWGEDGDRLVTLHALLVLTAANKS